jgi:hypothetical protein
LLLGGNVTVAKGRATGGDFRHVPACRRSRQTGCVVAYSTFDDPVPPDSLFGRTTGPGASRLRILCTNPASLRGGSGLLTTYVPTAPFGGTLGVALGAMQGMLPAVATPWIAYHRAYRARCSSAGGADVLQIAPVGGARALAPSPDPRWGLHLADVNIALGNLTALVGREARAYLRRVHRRAG